jgi:hypothetical protein
MRKLMRGLNNKTNCLKLLKHNKIIAKSLYYEEELIKIKSKPSKEQDFENN